MKIKYQKLKIKSLNGLLGETILILESRIKLFTTFLLQMTIKMIKNLQKKYSIIQKINWMYTEIWKNNIIKKMRRNRKKTHKISKKQKKKNLNSKEKLWNKQIS